MDVPDGNLFGEERWRPMLQPVWIARAATITDS